MREDKSHFIVDNIQRMKNVRKKVLYKLDKIKE